MDFVHDQLVNGSKLRLLTVIVVFTREALAIEVGAKLLCEHVAAVLSHFIYLRGATKAALCDNGADFAGQIIDLWAYTHRGQTGFLPARTTRTKHFRTKISVVVAFPCKISPIGLPPSDENNAQLNI